MTHGVRRLNWLWLAVTSSYGVHASGADASDPPTRAREPSSAEEASLAGESDSAGAATANAPEIRWHLGLALSVLSYQRADFRVAPLASGQSLPGLLERTNIGPSGGSVIFEPGYVLDGRLVLGMMLDIGSGLNESEVKDLSFEISQSQASFAFGPRVAYYLAPSSRLRPFGSAAFGYTFTPSKQAGQGLRLTMYQGFAGLGLAYFPSRHFSFDTSVRAAYGIGSGYVDTGVLKNAALSGSIYTLMWTIGTSGWLL